MSLTCSTLSCQRPKCEAIAAPVATSTRIATRLPIPKRRATAVISASSPVRRTAGTSATTSTS